MTSKLDNGLHHETLLNSRKRNALNEIIRKEQSQVEIAQCKLCIENFNLSYRNSKDKTALK